MTDQTIIWPQKTRDLKNPLMDSTYWDDLELRDGDVVVSTYSRSGTTWTQQIVAQILFRGEDVPLGELSPWVEFALAPKEAMLATLRAQTRRRIMKTHLQVDALGIDPSVKYLYIGRDGPDVALSLQRFVLGFPSIPGVPGAKSDFNAFFDDWLTLDGVPQGPFWSNVQSWWNVRKLPNVLVLHFARLKADLPGEMRRIAAFLGEEIEAELWPTIIEHCGFDYMKSHANEVAPSGAAGLIGGRSNFFKSGAVGGGRAALKAELVQRYEQEAAAKLTPDCAHWLKTGELPD